MGQARLIEQTGLKAETISRVKRRDDIELGTLAPLAGAVGLQVVLQLATAGIAATRTTQPHGASLSNRRFGLAWSNPRADEAVLLRNALVQGRFDAIVEWSGKQITNDLASVYTMVHNEG